MNLYWIQPFWLDGFSNFGNAEQRNLLTIQIPNASIFVQSAVTAFGPGVDFDAGVVGVVGMGVREWTAGGSNSGVQPSLVGHVSLNNCTSITMELALILCTASASGLILYVDD